VVAVIVGLTPLRDNAWWKESLGAYVLTQVLESLRPALPQEFGSLLPSWE
jgi:membrane protein required for colicin V production